MNAGYKRGELVWVRDREDQDWVQRIYAEYTSWPPTDFPHMCVEEGDEELFRAEDPRTLFNNWKECRLYVQGTTQPALTSIEEMLQMESYLSRTFDSEARVALALLEHLRESKDRLLDQENQTRQQSYQAGFLRGVTTPDPERAKILQEMMQADEEFGLYDEDSTEA